jgi:hypothetical protein
VEWQSSLEAIAEVSIAFAGFSAVIAIIRRAGAGAWLPQEIIGLWAMLGASVGSLFFSLLPLPLYHLGISDPSLWTVCSASLAVYVLTFYVLALRAVSRHGSRRPRLTRVMNHFPLFIFVLLICNALDIFISRGVGAYLAALVLLLLGGVYPLLVIVSFIEVQSPRGRE